MNLFKYHIIFAFSILLLTSCHQEADIREEFEDNNDFIEFELIFDTRDSEDNPIEKDDESTEPEDDGQYLENLDDYFKEGESTVLLSQRALSLGINFDDNSSNCYKYIYYKNESANWETGFNFKSENPISWTKIKRNGQFENGYAFGVLFYPRNYKKNDCVEADQSIENNFIGSDILGAWHRTNTEQDRLRFRLNHLMCKIAINLYIPIYQESTNNGMYVDDIKATALSFKTDFDIKWPGSSTESPPVAITNEESARDIYMFKKGEEDNFYLSTLPLFGDYGDSDIVKKFSFEAYFPQQYLQGDLFRFVLERGEKKYNYTFRLSTNVNLSTEPGYITQIELYLPRTDNNIVLLKAYLKEWGKADAPFTIMPDEPDDEI